MNLNYNNLNVDSISDDVRRQYAFPEDKEWIRRFVAGEKTLTKDEKQSLENEMKLRFFVSSLAYGVGTYAYFKLLMPAGTILRAMIDQKQSRTQRFFKRFVPFAGLAFPILMVRNLIEFQNNQYGDQHHKSQ